MTYTQFAAEVDAAVATIVAASSGALQSMPNVDYSIASCEAASAITGADTTLAKMFNLKFRTDAAALMFERAA